MIEINQLTRVYKMGDNEVYALNGVSLTIEDGDFVAIMGPSGSGKSTLSHILGLLDTPTSGSYKLNGKEVSGLSEDELAVLRRDEIGFIFQQFNLLPRMSAQENVALPLLYAHRSEELDRSQVLLEQVGLGARLHHRPNELSGGQQQRVAIARSLVNEPRMIIADEPTGNLDSQSEKEILGILNQLNARGITVVMVTHEEQIGLQAKRLIRMRDGVVQSDERRRPLRDIQSLELRAAPEPPKISRREVFEHFHQGFKTLIANKVRTGLSMLGILIGVAAVVAMLALGRGAQKAIESQLESLGSNMLVLRMGSQRIAGVAREAGSVARLTIDDARFLKEKIPAITAISGNVTGRGQVTYVNKNWNTQVQGVSPSFAEMRASYPEIGRFFSEEENKVRARVAVLGTTLANELFGDENPVGAMIKINKVIFQVIGVLKEKGAGPWRDQDDVVIIPLLTAMFRLLGKDYIDSIDIEVDNPESVAKTQEEVLEWMYARKKVPLSQRQDAFQIRNMADVQEALSKSSQTMSWLLASIAAISLLVGGIGIMNIMLVSVTERTKEIGLRKAIGARRMDILLQFLAESVVVSAVGGVAGIFLGWFITIFLSLVTGWATSISLTSVVGSFLFSAIVGLIFGIYPAKQASLLDPIDALRYE